MSSWPCFERQSRRLAQWLVAPQRVASGGAVCSQRVRCQTGQLRRNVRGWAWVRCGDRICWQVGRGDAKSLPASAAMCACGFSLSARTFQRAFRCQSCVREIGFVSCDVRARARDRDGAPQAAAVLVVDIRGVRARVRAARDAEPPRLQRAALGHHHFSNTVLSRLLFTVHPRPATLGIGGRRPGATGDMRMFYRVIVFCGVNVAGVVCAAPDVSATAPSPSIALSRGAFVGMAFAMWSRMLFDQGSRSGKRSTVDCARRR